jgi:NADH:ubiquinone oxidoreductase subunit D
VKRNYADAYFEVLTPDEQDNIDRIQVQRWNGVPDSGKWVSQDVARMPVAKKNQIIEDDDDDLEEDAVEASLQTV